MSTITSSPAKLILFGEQCVVHGAKAIATSLNLRTYCKIIPNNENKVLFFLPDLDTKGSWTFDQLKYNGTIPNNDNKKIDEKFLNFLENISDGNKGSLAFLYLLLSITGEKLESKGGISVYIASEFQFGVGLGSSAAFNVSIASALIHYFKLENNDNHDEKYLSIDGEEDLLRPNPSILQQINEWAFEAEKIMHGSPSGIDNSTSTFGGAISFKKGVIETINNVPNFQLIITNTKQPRSTKQLVTNVSLLHQKYTNITSHLFDAVDNISNTALKIFKDFKEENRREYEDEMGTLIHINQQILNAIGVGHEVLDKVVNIGKKHFSFHGKLTGAGGGGCAFTLIPKDTDPNDIEEFRKLLENEGFDTFPASIGALGVVLHKENIQIFREE